jgi:hypothetical protein
MPLRGWPWWSAPGAGCGGRTWLPARSAALRGALRSPADSPGAPSRASGCFAGIHLLRADTQRAPPAHPVHDAQVIGGQVLAPPGRRRGGVARTFPVGSAPVRRRAPPSPRAKRRPPHCPECHPPPVHSRRTGSPLPHRSRGRGRPHGRNHVARYSLRCKHLKDAAGRRSRGPVRNGHARAFYSSGSRRTLIPSGSPPRRSHPHSTRPVVSIPNPALRSPSSSGAMSPFLGSGG